MSQPQEYKNHVRLYPQHHLVFLPIAFIAVCCSAWQIFQQHDNKLVWSMITIALTLVLWLSIMLRQHYGVTAQNRIILMEMRFRYYVITHERLEKYESQLSKGQIFALRFASDDELPVLLQKAILENLKPDAIKKSIKIWQPDYLRI
ncbi:MAG: DUF6526 family protein [Chryseolinea sp.]